MLKQISPNRVLFIDIETVPEYYHWEEVPEKIQQFFEKKTRYKQEKEGIPFSDFYRENAGIWAEFGKIICISCGIIYEGNKFKVKSFYGNNEAELLSDFVYLLNTHYTTPRALLCAHNGKEFDFPYLARRIIINGMSLPNALNLSGKKPWEVPHIDTMDLWRFGDHKSFTSLELLANLLGIPTPKDDIDGSQVARVYYEEKNLERIRLYCEKDVLTTAQIFRKFRGEELLIL